jgi:hypothetical protein
MTQPIAFAVEEMPTDKMAQALQRMHLGRPLLCLYELDVKEPDTLDYSQMLSGNQVVMQEDREPSFPGMG